MTAAINTNAKTCSHREISLCVQEVFINHSAPEISGLHTTYSRLDQYRLVQVICSHVFRCHTHQEAELRPVVDEVPVSVN